jgi:hypothetical protein
MLTLLHPGKAPVRRRGQGGSPITAISIAVAVCVSPAQAGDPAAGWCLKTDMNFDRQRTSVDIDLLVAALIAEGGTPATVCAADCDLDGDVDGADIPHCIAFALSPDSDGDGLPDIMETHDGLFLGPTRIGTNPALVDTDADGLRDGDEVFDTTAGLDLHALGASPIRKDIFVEVDWFDESEGGSLHTHRPTPTAIAMITTPFANSPVTNPYGGPAGISLHVDYGQGGAYTEGNLIPGGDVVVLFDSEFNAYKALHFNPNRFTYFHYSIFAHHYDSTSNFSSGYAEIVGDDFMVTLQNALFDDYVANTMMHELGHNLRLRHGGTEDLNLKPNYNSVMNYRYQFPGVDINCDGFGDGVLDYSTGLRPELREMNLNENAGVCGLGTVPIDWDASGSLTTGLSWNINCYAGISSACGVVNGACGDNSCGRLVDSNDWSGLVLSGATQGDFVGPEIVRCQDVPGSRPER